MSELRTLDCDHRFCTECINQHLVSIIRNGTIGNMSCPQAGCPTQVDYYIIKACLDPADFDRYEKFSVKEELKDGNEILYTCDCNESILIPKDLKFFQCLSCHKKVCLKCNIDHAEDITCDEH